MKGSGAYDLKVMEVLNAGSFGEVYKIRRFNDNKLFALKKSMIKNYSKTEK